jgi:hypothetical protein
MNNIQTTEEVEQKELGVMQNPLSWWTNAKEESATEARWIALFEAVNIIADKAEEKGIPIEKVEFKPLAIHKYMESTENIILRKLLQEKYKIDVCYSDEPGEPRELEAEIY